MGYWERFLEGLSVPGLLLLAVGVLLVIQAAKLCRWAFREKGEGMILPMRILGLAMVVFSALIFLDFISGL